MNTQLVEFLTQAILSLPTEERALLEAQLFANLPYPSHLELSHLTESSQTFDFLYDEPDL
ncbi:hypothetical protein [Leptolyngbya sp. FACHB-36]|uniref:hypothetical protein n=1 Tax=Leptolyngbya sp. FACHB-36 TaxID=2692808 RepID=UPI0018EFF2F7|nr:hypothetical protein [Leptolyngbya sp. FACHB-36]